MVMVVDDGGGRGRGSGWRWWVMVGGDRWEWWMMVSDGGGGDGGV